MTPTALLFAATGMLSIAGLLASLAKPVWFRFNGATPRRWTIGAVWLLIAVFCAVCAAVQMNVGPPTYTPSTTSSTSDLSLEISTESSPVLMVPQVDIDVPMDAARPTQELATDVVPAPPPEAPSPVPRSRRLK